MLRNPLFSGSRPGWIAWMALCLVACQPSLNLQQETTRIDWDSWGVPHISASTEAGFFHADGWAQMNAHANTILELYGQARGRAAEYQGIKQLPNDQLIHTLNHPQLARTMWRNQHPGQQHMFTAFVAGMNAWAAQHPEMISDANRNVLPVTGEDVLLHGLRVINTRFIAGRELGYARQWGQNGSNAMAIGPARSESGHALLLQNPHLPWTAEYLFFEKHLLLGTGQQLRNIYGVSLVGMPGFAIGFNRHLGWTHTNNPIDSADLYQLQLTPNGYRFDGQELSFETRDEILKVRNEDGTFDEHLLSINSSVHGPVVARNDATALALRHVGGQAPDSIWQWWQMAQADSFEAFEAALRLNQLPFWNVLYADGSGEIYYRFNGFVPRREHGDWAFWQAPVDGSVSENLWQENHAFDELPTLKNPVTGWLHNANDPPWTSTLPQQLHAQDFPAYMSGQGMEMRPQRAAAMLLADASISFEELIAIKHDTQMQLAERLVDDLLVAAKDSESELIAAAAQVLSDWDQRADNTSQGAVLFQNWARAAARSGELFAGQWNSAMPVSTPDGLKDPQASMAILETVANNMLEQYGQLDISWGEVNRIRYAGHDLPANGAASDMGTFRVAAARPEADGTQTVVHGDSWVALVEFSDPPRAKVLLSYGNSTQPGSAHFGDQLELFSQQDLREAWFTPQALEGNIVRTDTLELSPELAMTPD